MSVSFPEDLHPKQIPNTRLKYDFISRPMQYLEYFGVINSIERRFVPLDIVFNSYDQLKKFLHDRGIIYTEINDEVKDHVMVYKEMFVVDTSKIYDSEIDLNNKILQYKFYSVNEISDMLSFSRPTIYKILNSGELRATRINGQLRIKHSDFVDYVNKGSIDQ